jgi:hypothetical protein
VTGNTSSKTKPRPRRPRPFFLLHLLHAIQLSDRLVVIFHGRFVYEMPFLSTGLTDTLSAAFLAH